MCYFTSNVCSYWLTALRRASAWHPRQADAPTLRCPTPPSSPPISRRASAPPPLPAWHSMTAGANVWVVRLWDRIEGLGVGDLVPRSVFGAGLSNRIWHTRAREWAGERVFACRVADYDFEARFPRKGQTRTPTCANGSSGRPTGMVTASVVRRGVNSFAFQFKSDI